MISLSEFTDFFIQDESIRNFLTHIGVMTSEDIGEYQGGKELEDEDLKVE